MTIKIHHLNCGTMHMPGAPLVCHVLLLETANGLVLVDSGYGTKDIENPWSHIGPYRVVIRPSLLLKETALYQVRALGFQPEDVKHIILTHFDIDHAGGISDFPHAIVHSSHTEVDVAFQPKTIFEHLRYNSLQWDYHPEVIGHEPGDITWNGFEGATELTQIDKDILLIPMAGHARGHAAIAVKSGNEWILHAGDAFYHHGRLDGAKIPMSLRLQEYAFAYDRKKLYHNIDRLHELHGLRIPGLKIVNAHDPTLLETAKGSN